MDHCGVKKRSINPRQTANLFSLLTFTYSWDLIKRAYQHGLSEDDLYEVVKNCRSKFLGKKLEKDYIKQQQKKNPKSVFLILWKLFGLKYFLVGCFDLCFRIAKSYFEPDALSNLIFFFSEGQTRITRNDAYYYLAIVLFFNYMVTIIYDNMIVYFVIIGIQIRTAFSSFLYRKALKLSPTALAEISVGNIVTLITKDVQTFEKGIWTINHAWIGIVHCSVVTYLLYCRIGITTLAGIVLYFLIIPVQMYLGNILKKFRIETNRYTDQRLQIFQEALSVIKIIKMYTWEDYFLGKVDTARKLEIKKMLGLLYLRIAVETSGLLVSKLGFYLLVMAYVWINEEADATTVFFIMSNYGTISYTLGILIPDCITTSYEFLSTTTRLNLVLRAKELPIPKIKEKTSRPTINIKDATVSLGKENILNNISLKVIPGLTLVTGQVGSGKSSLLKLMLQSYPLNAGNVCVEGRISYASQDPWLFPSSIKQNILFGQDLDPKRVDDQQHVINLKAKLMQHDIIPLDPHQNKSFALLRNGTVLKGDMKDFNFTNNNNVSNSINGFKNVNIINSDLTKENITHEFDKSQERAKNTFKWYYIMLFSGAVMDIIKTGIIYDICRRASINLHYALVKNILNAVMNFFDTHFIGNILNRLSQDLVMMDERLGYILNESFGVIYMMCGTVILIVSVNNLFIFYTVFVIICLVTLGRIYLPFNRNMKRLEASTRSPMIGHLNATLEGITTVRAYKAEDILTDEFDRHHDLFTSTYYTRNVYHRAYGFCASFLSTTLLTMLILTFIFMDTGASAGDVGLALSQAFLLGSFIASAVNVYTDLETMMTSVERVFEYTDIETEKHDGTLVTGWPKKGSISYEYVSLTYNKTDHILKNVSFEVNSNEKVGIIGRTGAGKSSLISTIFRLYQIHGKILVDKVDIKTLPLKTLRKNIAIIPQDPVLFSGTIRSNLDPFNKFNDEELWNAIGKANLKGFITELDSKIMASSSSLSLGQKQMFCVARAILSNAKIIVLDEATANMDNETQTLVNKSIKDNFSACTVLTIAHRLENIVDSDKILVMDRGEVIEYDNPEQLLKNKESYFSKMVQKSLKF
ncbi:ATP-binding cassette subfamily C member 4-like isoform X2 [Diabrotica undecimpunctata]|uniref:ATP-binding cassette subfamily C member 4-like isoform X2 n=1 Tax=Diabrotica undecimpunctata TaxID=50387 RepID=UPI003B6326FB